MILNSHWCRAFAFSVLISAVPALAANLGFMKDSPYGQFTEQDLVLFNETLNDVLSNGAEGELQSWSNPKTQAGGEMKPLKSFERKGLACRTLSITNKAKGRTATGRYDFCKQESGKWLLAN